MSKFSFSIVAALLASMVSHAADTLDGCGLGWQVTDKKSYTATTTRATTNVVVPPTFGMTTGTMGCDKLEVGANEQKGMNYVATNFEVLKTELAMGQGEYVDGMIDAMGCSANAGAKVQSQYKTVVAPAKNAVELYKGIRSVCI